MKRSLIIFLLSFLSINCILEDKKELKLTLSGMDESTVGKKGTILISLKQDVKPYEQIRDFSKKAIFDLRISNDNTKTKYTVNCGVWSRENHFGEIGIFCNLNETVPAGNYTILLSELKSFDYKDYKVNIDIGKGEQYLKFDKYDMDIIDLHSDEQNITLEEGKENYEIKFNIISYHQEKLHLGFSFIVDNCIANNGILSCPLTKSDILKYFNPAHNDFSIWAFNPAINEVKSLYFIPEINVIVPDMKKKHIYVEIKKLLINANSIDVPVAYETNVTEISNYYDIGDLFDLTFINKNKDNIEREEENGCRFLKYDNNPLLLVCFVDTEGTNWLKEFSTEKYLDDINYQYIYHLLPYKNEEKIETVGQGSYAFWSYPKSLDFTKNNDTLFIDINMEKPDYYKGLTFIEGVEDLKCQNIIRDIAYFIVRIAPFQFL